MLMLLALDKKNYRFFKNAFLSTSKCNSWEIIYKHWILNSIFCRQQVIDTSSVVHPRVSI